MNYEDEDNVQNQNTADNMRNKRAVAVKYTSDQRAPKVTAKGKGYVADNIVNAGINNAVPVYKNQTLVNMLMAVELDREIPPEMYAAVAEVLAYVYRIDKNKVTRSRPFINRLLRP